MQRQRKFQWMNAALAAGALATPMLAAPKAEAQVSGVAGADFYTHFVSYGFDVWGAGTDFGDNATFNPYAEIAFEIEDFSIVIGTWWDVNDNAPSSIGGHLQEVDVYFGVGYTYERFSFGITYQDWVYGGGTEKILDLSVGFDDSGLYGDSEIALNPSFVAHKRVGSTNITGDTNGWAFVFGIEPGFTLVESEDFTVDASIPVSLAFGTDDFYAESGFGFFSVGLAVSAPLVFIPEEYGEWSVGAGLTLYVTDEDAIGNPDDTFLVGNVGFSVAF